MAPARVGFSAGWRAAAWDTHVAVTRVTRQERTSSFDLRDGEPESATPGYTTVDAGVNWRVRDGATPVTLYLLGRNLTDADIRVHTSFLKAIAPPPGRSLVAGVRAAF
jgi:iron complex outermembrane receptor protein